ncbi:hypothetical protein LCGC14_1817710 [marine sediment metagenome]|uniref:Uncharacterized protein n=1 Tax=marine sediment metagenome TaxID=412755 RepID=A0A0F9GJW4_9ZZZZ
MKLALTLGNSTARELSDWMYPMPDVAPPKGIFRKRCPVCGGRVHGQVIEEYFDCQIHDGFGDHWRLFEYKCTGCPYVYRERH